DERSLGQHEFGLLAKRAELDAHRGLVAARARPIRDLVRRPAEGQQLGPLHVDIHTRLGEALAARLVALDAPGAARPRVELADIATKARRAPPHRELPRVG